jgi:hypothetical protein
MGSYKGQQIEICETISRPPAAPFGGRKSWSWSQGIGSIMPASHMGICCVDCQHQFVLVVENPFLVFCYELYFDILEQC